jgi:type II secretory pathway pseudopilin PulG
MDAPPSVSRKDAGETLIELLVAVVIMGIAVVAVVGGISTSIMMSDIHHKQATAGANVRDYAEAVENAVATSTTTGAMYTACATLPAGAHPAYSPAQVGYSVPAGYTAQVTSITYWNGSSLTFGSTCTVATDSGVQMVAIKVASGDLRATETLRVIIRNPCRSGDAACS